MKTTELARLEAEKLVKRFGTRDPFLLAERTGVTVLYRNFETQKGAFSVVLGQPFVFLSSALDEHDAAAVLAHELGHARLHFELARKGALIEHLNARLSRGPENSSLPPSSEPNRKRIPNSREKTGRKPGGQPRHPGHGRRMPEPEEAVFLLQPKG